MQESPAQEDALDLVNRQFLIGHPARAADAIESFSRSEAVEVLAAQPAAAVASVWPHLSPARIDEIVPELPDALLTEVLRTLDPAVGAASMLRMSEESREHCLALLPSAEAAEVRRFMDYPPGSAGRVMDTRALTFRPEQTVGAALETLRRLKPRDARLLFLVGPEQTLVSAVDIQQLAIADPDEQLGDIAHPAAAVSPFDDREEVAERLKQYQLDALPVVDPHDRLIGVIHHGALLKTLQETTSADIQMMVGAGREERALSRPGLAVRQRLLWLQTNLLTAFLAAAVVGVFESTIAQFTALAVLLPVVAGQAGNAGAQALAVTIRGLALREISTRHWLRVMIKEVQVGVVNGVAVAVTTGIAVYVWSRSVGLALVIMLSMVLAMVAAGVAGSLIPISLTRLGQDPAQSSSILLTTVTDITGFFSFLGIATLLAAML
ncbi:MAG TPA: magnesium transporter [Gammaproteobacteria bacterium]